MIWACIKRNLVILQGLDPRNMSSANDLLIMMKAVNSSPRYHSIRNFPQHHIMIFISPIMAVATVSIKAIIPIA